MGFGSFFKRAVSGAISGGVSGFMMGGGPASALAGAALGGASGALAGGPSATGGITGLGQGQGASSGREARSYYDEAFPGTNPWERLGAGNPMGSVMAAGISAAGQKRNVDTQVGSARKLMNTQTKSAQKVAGIQARAATGVAATHAAASRYQTRTVGAAQAAQIGRGYAAGDQDELHSRILGEPPTSIRPQLGPSVERGKLLIEGERQQQYKRSVGV